MFDKALKIKRALTIDKTGNIDRAGGSITYEKHIYMKKENEFQPTRSLSQFFKNCNAPKILAKKWTNIYLKNYFVISPLY